MYFDFEESHPDTPSLERAISWRDGVFASITLHLVFFLAILYVPRLPIMQAAMARAEAERVRLAQLQRERERDAERRFVFVQPRQDLEAPKPPPRPELSDKDRLARAPEQAQRPENALPFARGNSAERVEAPDAVPQPPRGTAPTPPLAGADGDGTSRDRNGAMAPPVREAPGGLSYNTRPPSAPTSRPGLAGAIENALRHIDRYVPESFNNPQGGVSPYGPTIQFDTKGVEFGPWLRRFVAQVKRNWFVPYAAMSLRGHVVITFFVHRDGTITDLTVVQPSTVESFTNAAYNALAASNPTQPLPPEYPADRAFFTVTFYYNETPPSGP
jgi:TonB family protein